MKQYISSRSKGETKKYYKNSFWKWFFSFKLAKKIFPKLNDNVQYEKIIDIEFLNYDLIEIEEGCIFQNNLAPESGVYYLKEEIQEKPDLIH